MWGGGCGGAAAPLSAPIPHLLCSATRCRPDTSSTGVRLICTNQVGAGARTTVVNTQGGRSVRDNILALFGGKATEGVEPLQVRAAAGREGGGGAQSWPPVPPRAAALWGAA